MKREEILSGLKDPSTLDLRKHLPAYLHANPRHDLELLQVAWPVVTQNGILLKDFLFHYARMNSESCVALLNKIQETLAAVPLISDNLPWFEWWGKALDSGLGHAGHLYDFVQPAFGSNFDFLFGLAQQILALERFAGGADTHVIVAPWLKLLAGYDHATTAQHDELAETILRTLLESQRSEDYPVSYLVRFPGTRIDTLLECLTRCMNVTKKDDVKASLSGGSHMANIRSMVYLHALLVVLLHQKVGPEELADAVHRLQWSDHKIFLLAVVLLQDIGFALSGVRLEKDPADWFAAQPLAKPMLLALFKPESADDGQVMMKRSLERLGFIARAEKLPKIGKIPNDLTGALKLIRTLKFNPGEIEFGKPATAAALAKAKLKVKIPRDLLALYREYDGIAGEIVPVKHLPALQKDFQDEIRALLEEGPEDENFSGDDIDIRTLLPLSDFTAISETSSGDYLFLHAKARTIQGHSPVLRYCHDQSFVCKVEAESLPFFAARLFLLRWAELNGFENIFSKLLFPKTRLVKSKKKS